MAKDHEYKPNFEGIIAVNLGSGENQEPSDVELKLIEQEAIDAEQFTGTDSEIADIYIEVTDDDLQYSGKPKTESIESRAYIKGNNTLN